MFLFGCGPHPSWFQLVILEECEVCQEPGWCFIPLKTSICQKYLSLLSPYGLVFVWYQHLNIPPSWYWVLFKPVRDFSGYSQKTLNQWQSSWHGGGHLTFLEWSLTHFGRARCCSFLARWKVSLQISDKSIRTGRPLEQGHYQNLVLSSTDLGEHLVLGRFVLPVLIPMLIPGSILYTRPILVHTFYQWKKYWPHVKGFRVLVN